MKTGVIVPVFEETLIILWFEYYISSMGGKTLQFLIAVLSFQQWYSEYYFNFRNIPKDPGMIFMHNVLVSSAWTLPFNEKQSSTSYE